MSRPPTKSLKEARPDLIPFLVDKSDGDLPWRGRNQIWLKCSRDGCEGPPIATQIRFISIRKTLPTHLKCRARDASKISTKYLICEIKPNFVPYLEDKEMATTPLLQKDSVYVRCAFKHCKDQDPYPIKIEAINKSALSVPMHKACANASWGTAKRLIDVRPDVVILDENDFNASAHSLKKIRIRCLGCRDSFLKLPADLTRNFRPSLCNVCIVAYLEEFDFKEILNEFCLNELEFSSEFTEPAVKLWFHFMEWLRSKKTFSSGAVLSKHLKSRGCKFSQRRTQWIGVRLKSK